jgi:hypothetical protein
VKGDAMEPTKTLATVTMWSPRAFNLICDDHRKVEIKRGLNLVPADCCDHYYLKAHGVKRVEEETKHDD